ncbi:MAG: ATP-binding protein [Verrucomicrobiaceae bacterium]|nr:ATP-binding protein [Verrucomicrobiaceae bacterium]
MPDPEKLRQHRSLRFFQRWLNDPNLWHLNRYSVSAAVFIGLLIAFIPLPIHIVICTLVAIWWRANLPIALSVIWISNPFTIPPQFYMAYKVGSLLLRRPEHHFSFELSLQWLGSEFSFIWQPLLLGCAVCGFAAAFLGAALVRIIWRLQVIARWRARKNHRQNQPKSH